VHRHKNGDFRPAPKAKTRACDAKDEKTADSLNVDFARVHSAARAPNSHCCFAIITNCSHRGGKMGLFGYFMVALLARFSMKKPQVIGLLPP
jgi:hypothetical protein